MREGGGERVSDRLERRGSDGTGSGMGERGGGTG